MEQQRIVEQAELIRINAQLARVFSPSAPVNRVELFAGRMAQITQVLSAVSQVGQHAAIFGERGVGKTSLASLIHTFWNDSFKDIDTIAPGVNCDAADTFTSVWIKVVEEIQLIFEKQGRALPAHSQAFDKAMSDILHGDATPNLIRRFLDLAAIDSIIILDEFDRLADRESTRLMADTIKTLSDQAVHATLIIVAWRIRSMS